MQDKFNNHLKYILSQLEKVNKNDSLKILDIFVALSSRISVDVNVNKQNGNSTINSISYYETENGYEVENARIVLNESHIETCFKELLQNGLLELINNSSIPNGIKLNERPLILAPIWESGIKENLCQIDIPSALNIYKKTVLLGQPGSGKSTIVKAIACAFLEKIIDNQSNKFDKIGLWNTQQQLLPIFIEIKDFTKNDNFNDTPDYFNNYLKTNLCQNNTEIFNIYEESLQYNTAIVIFDGYDEIAFSENYETKWKQLQNLIEDLSITTYPKCKYIVTCRSTGYYNDKKLSQFETIKISDLNTNEISNIVDSYCKKYRVKENDITNFKKHISNPFYEELVKQPLFVYLLTTLYFKDINKPLPQIRSELLDRAIAHLIKSCLESNIDSEYNSLKNKLETMAYNSLKSGKGLIIPAENILTLNGKRMILEQAGLISQTAQEATKREYNFQLRLYQEYLAASYLSSQENGIELIINHLKASSDTWREVVLLLGDIYLEKDKFWELLNELISIGILESIWLANKIILQHQHIERKLTIGTFKNQANDLRDKSFEILCSCNFEQNKENAKKKADIAKAMALYGDKRQGVGLTENKLPDIAWCKILDCKVTIGLTDGEAQTIRNHIRDLAEDPYNYKQDWSFDREQPSKEFFIKSFEISRYPITVCQFQSFIDAEDGYQNDEWWTEKGKQWKETGKLYQREELQKEDIGDNFPRTYVSWYECIAFCNWLGNKLNCKLRLPTEIEWEAAAKKCKDNIYPWGNSISEHNHKYNTKELGVGKIIPVGCLNQTNLCNNEPVDMIGNIWEWCNSAVEINDKLCKYDSYNHDTQENTNIQGYVKRAARGGGYGNVLIMSRCAFRGRDLEHEQLYRQGFRIVKETSIKIDVEDTRIESVSGGSLHVHKRSNQSGRDKPVIIFSHGFITDGLENHRMFLNIAKQLNKENYSTVLFDNYGCGYSDGEYTDFRFSNAIKDLVNVVNWAIENCECNKEVILFGQSLGTAIITCTIKNILPTIKTLIFWNFSDDIKNRYPKVFKDDIKDGIDMKGGVDFYIERKGILVSGEFYTDACLFNISEELKNINSPTLFINSGADEIGNPALSDNAKSIIDKKVSTKKFIIEGANHTFNCQPEQEQKAIDYSINWIKELSN